MHRLHDVKGSDRIMSVRLQQFCDIDECPHAKTGNPAWQESVLMHWYDGKAGIGGLQRIGHEPNRDGGKAVLWSHVFTTEDRKRGVEGKSVSVRVDLGGRRIIQKKQPNTNTK